MKEVFFSGKKQLIFALLIAFIASLNFGYDIFIRITPSVMTDVLMKDLSLNTTTLGFLSAAYFYAYIAFQIPAGLMLDKYNTRFVFSLALFICILGNIIFQYANGFWLAFLGRFLMGAGSAFGWIGAAKIASMWLPERFFSSFMSVLNITGLIGGFLVGSVFVKLVNDIGWRNSNSIVTYAGIILMVFILLIIRDNTNHKKHSSTETLLDKLKQLCMVLKNSKIWIAAFLVSSFFGSVNIFVTLWGTSFISHKFDISESHATTINSLFFIWCIIGNFVIAFLGAHYSKYRNLLIFAGITSFIALVIAIFLSVPIGVFIFITFIISFASGFAIFGFDIVKRSVPNSLVSTAIGGMQMISFAIQSISIPFVGWVLSLRVAPDGSNTFFDYQIAFSILPLSLLIIIPFIFTKLKND